MDKALTDAERASMPCVIVLASGRGERFRAAGGSGSKLQAPLGNGTVLGHTIDAVRASGLAFHVEDAGHPGMADSIAAAVRATASAHGWLILPGDLPLVRPASLLAVARALAGKHGASAVEPWHAGQRGHPVGFSKPNFEALAALSGSAGAASVLRELKAGGRVEAIELDDEGIVTDVDTPQALERAQALWAARRASGC